MSAKKLWYGCDNKHLKEDYYTFWEIVEEIGICPHLGCLTANKYR